MSFFSGEQLQRQRQLELERKQLQLQYDPSAVFMRELSSGIPRVALQTLGTIAIDAAKYNLFGGKQELERRQRQTRSEDLARKSNIAQEFGAGEDALLEALGKEPTEETSQQKKQKPKEKPKEIKKIKSFDDGTFALETTEDKADFSTKVDGKPVFYKNISKEQFEALQSANQKAEAENERIRKSQQPKVPTYYEEAENNYKRITGKKLIGQSAQESIRKIAEKAQEDGRKKRLDLDKQIDAEIERYQDVGMLKSPESRKERLEGIVDTFVTRLGSLPIQERQSAYNSLVQKVSLAMGDEDVFAAERAILSSRNGGKVRQYARYGSRRNVVNIPKQRNVTKAVIAATKERERLFTEVRSVDSAIQTLESKLDSASPQDKKALSNQLDNLKKQREALAQRAEFQQAQIDSALNDPNRDANLNVRPYENPITGKAVLGATFSGTGSDQPAATRRENIRAQVLESTGGQVQFNMVLNNLSYIDPAAYEKVINSSNPRNELANIIADRGSTDVLLPPSEAAKSQRAASNLVITANVIDAVKDGGRDLAKIKKKFPEYETNATIGPAINKIRDGSVDFTSNEVEALALMGRLSGFRAQKGISLQSRLEDKYDWIDESVYDRLDNNFKLFLSTATVPYSTLELARTGYNNSKVGR